MKNFTLLLLLATYVAQAQPTTSNGYGSLPAINGTTYQKTGAIINTGNFGCVSAAGNGQMFFASGANSTSDKIYFINVATSTVTDSMSLPSVGGEMASSNEPNTLFSIRGSSLYRINTSSKSVDSIIIGNPFRVQERPGSKEVWVTADSMIYMINYTTALAILTTLDLSNNKFDNSDTRFTKGGSIAYKAANSLKKVYKIDAATKTVTDSINTAPNGATSVEVSSDSSKIYVANGGTTIYIYSVASKALVDSITGNKQVMNLYIHPTRQELWAVHHFADSASVYNETSKTLIAGFDIGNDPFFLAFATGTVGLHPIANTDYPTALYPNPATNELTVQFAANKIRDTRLTDQVGRIIKSYSSGEAKLSINVSGLTAGNYYINVYENGDLKKSLGFIKQ